VKLGVASAVCLLAAILMLAIRGAADWSSSFAIAWYATFGAAALLGLAAIAVAIATPHSERTKTALLGLPALIAVPVFVVLVLWIARLAS
jgi:hypothetical protein